ncbi:thioredoxin domain-containing protein 5 homolog [Ctenocephalides felis]|uniref:thioredoxin domain-containing protein 5 homolog n=1 Tax=Ctenocephalides felis TaxID=7515 RepID=UPI000E6E3306|nr:thioredoxin domain-containing protein 5 homolog [Ctenocephalides felis]
MNLIILFGLCFVTFCTGHEESPYTFQYTKENFQEGIGKNNHFIMFYAPWCGYCQKLAPTWNQLAEMLNSDEHSRVTIAKVDCTTDNEVCSQHDVTGYPTLLFFKLDTEEPVKFKGTRDLPTLTAFINEQIGANEPLDVESIPHIPDAVNGLVELTEDTFADHVREGQHFVKFYAPWCGHCQSLAPVWEKLASTFEHEDSVSIAKIDCTQHRPICTQFEVKGYPTLLWIEDGKKVEKYSGQRNHEELKAYVEKKHGASQIDDEDRDDNRIPDTNEEEGVFNLVGSNFEQGISKGVTFVKFFAPWCGHCKRLAPTWDDLAKKVVGSTNINVAKVDCTLEDNKELCSLQAVDGFPTLYLYKDGQKLSEYNGSRSLDDLYEFLMSHVVHDEL